MIRIEKPSTAPEVLTAKGVEQTRTDCKSFDADPDAYRSGEAKFDFNSGIYGHSSVKSELVQAQKGKCAFCESSVNHIAYGDVEHFRPKAAVQQSKDAKLRRPGYYWLAYAWSNLYFACQLCNQRFKRNLFPLINWQQRATSHQDDISREKPLFIDPGVDEPRDFIRFRAEVAYPVNGSRRGKATIEALGLNRAALAERRFEEYQRLSLIYELANSSVPELPVEGAKKLIERCTERGSEYSSMAQSAVEDAFEL